MKGGAEMNISEIIKMAAEILTIVVEAIEEAANS